MYNNNYIEFSYLQENLLGDAKQHFTNLKDLKEQWKKAASSFVKHKYISRYINDKQTEVLKNYYDQLCDDDVDYNTYKKAFRYIASFMGLPKDGIIIEELTFEKNKEDKEQTQITLRYSKGLVKVRIPDTVCLIHVTKAKDIDALNPSFKSRIKGKYMYPNKRVYFTAAKQVSANKMGAEHDKETLSKYTTKDTIEYAYIDPACTDFSDGAAVYIPTDKPIPVVPMSQKFNINNAFNLRRKEDTNNNKDNSNKDDKASSTNEGYDISMENEEVYISENFKDTLEMIKNWKVSNETKAKKEFKTTDLSDEEYMEMKGIFKSLHEDDYPEYKKSFDKLCKFCHIVPRGVIITKHELHKGKEEDKNTLYIEYAENTKKITLPVDSALYHMSRVADIDALNPTFRGKSDKGYLYDKPRIYFTINKDLPKVAADYKATEKVYKYKCLQNIKSVYVDPLVRSGLMGAVYVETNKPIKVEQL